jgi:gamma-glutamyltranspeptidase
VHAISEADRLAYADRGLYVADADFVPVDVSALVNPQYLAERAELIGDKSMGKAEPGTPPGSTLRSRRTARHRAFPRRRWWRWMTVAARCR